MLVRWLPLLQVQRDLLNTPRGAERFERYLATMRGSAGDLNLPLQAFNPMSKPHVAELLDRLLALDSEGIGEAAMNQAANELASVGVCGSIQVGLVVADDARGGWTNRWLFEAKHRFENSYEQRHGIVTALLWSSEPPHAQSIRQEVRAAIYRHAWIAKHGLPTTLQERMQQEGMAAHFAGVPLEPLPRQDEAVIDANLASTHYPTIIACLYGDDAAITCGYDPLGLPAHAGLRYALSRANLLPDVVALLR